MISQSNTNIILGPNESQKTENNLFNIPRVYLQYTKTTNPVQIRAWITGIIGEIVEFADLLHVLRNLNEEDKLTLFIDSPGGNLTTGACVATAVKSSKGRITTVARGFCASAGSLIWSSGDICKVRKGALLMYHCSSHLDFGNSLDVRDNANRLINYVKFILSVDAIRKGHITEDELNRILTEPKVEIYISDMEMDERLKARGSGSAIYDPTEKEVEEPNNDNTIEDVLENDQEPTQSSPTEITKEEEPKESEEEPEDEEGEEKNDVV
jgi:ATP-dependent protease ClpP protease subunit